MNNFGLCKTRQNLDYQAIGLQPIDIMFMQA